MKSFKSSALREKSTDELHALVAEKTESLFNLKIRHAAGTHESAADIGTTRRDIARLKGALTAKQAAK